MTENSQAEKAAVRAVKIALRSQVPEAEAAAAAASAAGHAVQLLGHLGHLAGKTVSLYMPIKGELDPRPLAGKLRDAGAIAALPHVASDTVPMTFRTWLDTDPLEKGFGGILEPSSSVPDVMPDIVIVPLAAFDRRGFRIGYGKGHFDRTLGPLARGVRPFLVGYAFALQEVDEVPRELHDVPLDAVVTETEIIHCNPARDGV